MANGMPLSEVALRRQRRRRLAAVRSSQPGGQGSTQESVTAQVVAALRCLAAALEMQHFLLESPVPRGEDLWGAGVAEGRWKNTGATDADEVALAAAAAGEEEMLLAAMPTWMAGSDFVTEVGNKGWAVCCTEAVGAASGVERVAEGWWKNTGATFAEEQGPPVTQGSFPGRGAAASDDERVAVGWWKHTGVTESRPNPEGPPSSGWLLGAEVADGRWTSTGATGMAATSPAAVAECELLRIAAPTSVAGLDLVAEVGNRDSAMDEDDEVLRDLLDLREAVRCPGRAGQEPAAVLCRCPLGVREVGRVVRSFAGGGGSAAGDPVTLGAALVAGCQ